MKRDVDEATGLMGTVIIEHKEDLHPQIVIVGDDGEVARELFDSGRRARHRRGEPENSGRRAARQDAAKSRQDQGHHRRSAACGRTVRSASSERRGRDREDRRHRRNRRHGSRQTETDPQGRRDRRRRGTPHSADQAHHRLQGRLREEGLSSSPKVRWSRTKSSRSADRRICRSTSSTKCRKFTASRASRLTTSTSRSSFGRCSAR